MKDLVLYHKKQINIWSDQHESIPILTAEEEIYLFNEYQKGDIGAAYEIVIRHMRFVDFLVNRYNATYQLKQDLLQEGVLQLMKCIKTYDISKGTRFMTFSRYHIERAMSEYLLKYGSPFTVGAGVTNRKMYSNLGKELSILKKEKCSDYISHSDMVYVCEKLNLNIHDAIDFHNRFNVSSANMVDGEEECIYDDLMSGISVEGEIIEQEMNDFDLLTVIDDVLDTREKEILCKRYVNEKPMTLRELSAEYGVSIERIRQIESKAISKVKSAVGK